MNWTPTKPRCMKCAGGIQKYHSVFCKRYKLKTQCELCQGTGYFKSNTAEFEGPCPNGCCSDCGKPINSEWHQGKTCFNGPWEDEEGR